MEAGKGDSRGSSWFWGALTLLLVAFKLAHLIEWSWWWVLAPMWIPLGVWLVVVLVVALVVGVKK